MTAVAPESVRRAPWPESRSKQAGMGKAGRHSPAPSVSPSPRVSGAGSASGSRRGLGEKGCRNIANQPPVDRCSNHRVGSDQSSHVHSFCPARL